MDPDAPNNRIRYHKLKEFLDYSKSACSSEDAIYHIRTANAHQELRHLDVVDIPHENVSLNECWNFLDIPLSTDFDPRMG